MKTMSERNMVSEDTNPMFLWETFGPVNVKIYMGIEYVRCFSTIARYHDVVLDIGTNSSTLSLTLYNIFTDVVSDKFI